MIITTSQERNRVSACGNLLPECNVPPGKECQTLAVCGYYLGTDFGGRVAIPKNIQGVCYRKLKVTEIVRTKGEVYTKPYGEPVYRSSTTESLTINTGTYEKSMSGPRCITTVTARSYVSNTYVSTWGYVTPGDPAIPPPPHPQGGPYLAETLTWHLESTYTPTQGGVGTDTTDRNYFSVYSTPPWTWDNTVTTHVWNATPPTQEDTGGSWSGDTWSIVGSTITEYGEFVDSFHSPYPGDGSQAGTFATAYRTRIREYSDPVPPFLEGLPYTFLDAFNDPLNYSGSVIYCKVGYISGLSANAKSRYRLTLYDGYSTPDAPRSYYEAQWDEMFMPAAWDAWNTINLAYIARVKLRTQMTTDHAAALVQYDIDLAQYNEDVVTYAALYNAYEAEYSVYLILVDEYIQAYYAWEDWYYCEMWDPGNCGNEPSVPPYPEAPIAPVEPTPPAEVPPLVLPPLLPEPGEEPAERPMLIAARHWLWEGDEEAQYSDWYELLPLPALGSLRIVNVLVKCYRYARVGVAPTLIGEAIELQQPTLDLRINRTSYNIELL